jgi:hypothetical protein
VKKVINILDSSLGMTFFTRLFQPGVRPVDDPNDPNVIVNACESEPLLLMTNVNFIGIWIARADRARSIRYVSYRMDRIGLFCTIVDRIEPSIDSIRSTPYSVSTYLVFTIYYVLSSYPIAYASST